MINLEELNWRINTENKTCKTFKKKNYKAICNNKKNVISIYKVSKKTDNKYSGSGCPVALNLNIDTIEEFKTIEKCIGI